MTSAAIMRKIILWGTYLGLFIGVVGGFIGWLVADTAGLFSSLIATAIAIVFCLLTAVSILLGYRLSKGELISGAFFGVVLGGWVLKFIVFIAVVLIVREQEWLHPMVAFISLVVAVLGSLAVDIVVIFSSRQPTIDPSDPEDETLGRPTGRR